MMIVVVSAKKCVRNFILFLLIVSVIAAGSILISDTISVANPIAEKALPIYSVDIADKKVAITFDCAWGAGN